MEGAIKCNTPSALSLSHSHSQRENENDINKLIWRESSYDFLHDQVPPGFDFTKHDVEKGSFKRELDLENQCLSPVCESPNDYGMITPKQESCELFHRRSSTGRVSLREEDQVLRCSSNASFQRKGKSRLMDPPSMAGQRRSTMLGKSVAFEEDDPFDEDIPEEYKKGKFSYLTLVEWISLVLIVAALAFSLVVKKWRGKTVWGMQLWKWEVMGLVLVCGGLISGWFIRIVVFFIEKNFLLRKRVLYFVYGLRSSVQKFLWLGWVLIAWILILDKKVKKETHSPVLSYVTKILICFMVAMLLWLVKTLLLKVLAMNFHVSAFFDRVQDALFNQYVIETLSKPPCLELNGFGSGRSIGSGMSPSPLMGKSAKNLVAGKGSLSATKNVGFSIDRLHRLNQKNISAWNMKRMMSIVRKGVLSTLNEQLDPTAENDNAFQIHSENEAKCAAKRIFTNVARPDSRHMYLEDLMCFLGEDEANKTIHLFEGAGNGDGISKRATKNWVVNVFRERRALALSLNDTKTAVDKLHLLVNLLLGVAVIIIWLLILGVPITNFLVFVSSQVVVLAFVFGNTCKTTFEAIVFLFVMHPFDVGDRCEIEGVQMVVEEMNILTTVFLRYDNQKIIYPNNVLATKPISNYYRSPDMGDGIDFCVHISTPVEKLSLMKERITRYIEYKKEHWYTGPMIVMRDVEDMNRIKFSVWLSHTMNHQDMGERWARRALLVEEMVQIFRDLDIEYRMLPTEVNVRNMPSLASERLPSNWSVCAR